jgi:NAD(P)-dependent dehydrogenase (short-subunit alcohol dehydrogenase family)
VTDPEPAFDPSSTTDDVLEGVDLDGEVVLVTGASAGLGLETARSLASHGATVVAAVRELPKAEGAFAEAGIALGDRVTLEQVDLASLASVRAFTDRFVEVHDRLDVLVANAGLMACPRGTTADGFERQFGTNHLGHFVLVNRLVPLLLASAPSRVVCLTSSAHHMSDVDLGDPNFETTPYEPWLAYGRSKTANAQFAVELDRRLHERGVRAVAVHPGAVDTELHRHLDAEALAFVDQNREHVPKGVAVGAATTVWAATRSVVVTPSTATSPGPPPSGTRKGCVSTCTTPSGVETCGRCPRSWWARPSPGERAGAVPRSLNVDLVGGPSYARPTRPARTIDPRRRNRGVRHGR